MIQFIGLGNCGSRITKILDDFYKKSKMYVPSLYINFDKIDMMEIDSIPKKQKLLLEGFGTGRSPIKGEEFALKHKKTIKDFLVNNCRQDRHIIGIFGAGGGSGSGLAPVVSSILHQAGYKHGFVLTFPDSTSNSDLNTNQNAIITLNKMLKLDTNFRPFIFVDNQNLLDHLKFNDSNYWGEINTYIAESVISLVELFDDDGRINSEKGISNLDVGELKRIFATEGLMDIRYLVIPQQQLSRPDFLKEFAERVKNDESLCGKYDLKETLSYACTVITNKEFSNFSVVQGIFDTISKLTPGASIRRHSTIIKEKVEDGFYSERDIPIIKVILVASGFKLPKHINQKIKKIKSDSEKYLKTKSKESKVLLTEDSLNLFKPDDFDI
ncbi:MAG: hypothetical protein ABIK31_01725 [candidate division WOR-3 bacterium]